MPTTEHHQRPRLPRKAASRRSHTLAARLRAALPDPIDYALYAAAVVVMRLWLHISVPVAVMAVVASAVTVIAVSLLADAVHTYRRDSRGRRHGDRWAGGDG